MDSDARLVRLAAHVLSLSHLAGLSPPVYIREIAATRDVVCEEGGGAIERSKNRVIVLRALCVHDRVNTGSALRAAMYGTKQAYERLRDIGRLSRDVSLRTPRP